MSAVAHEKGESGNTRGAVRAYAAPSLFYVAVFVGLAALTALTVLQSTFDLGKLNMLLGVGIATLKALLVLGFFMHLAWDNKFYAYIVVTAIFFVGVFYTYTTNDTEKRGLRDPDQSGKILPATGAPAPGGFSP
ncbi:MAG: cytochrome C oxidase subunit IV family protein [Polyangiaceae bacterium]|nr:cytochrome C oxidase subunit IV family protein [Polyangiaceae bacterium]